MPREVKFWEGPIKYLVSSHIDAVLILLQKADRRHLYWHDKCRLRILELSNSGFDQSHN